MVQQLIRQWRLAVLRVSLDLTRSDPAVHATVLGFPSGTQTELEHVSLPPEAYGISSRERGLGHSALFVPDELVDRVRTALRQHFDAEPALWLHLEEPRGYLGAVPWEAALIGEIDIPVLRIPNRLPVTVPLAKVYSIAVIATGAEPARLRPHLQGMLLALSERVDRPVEVHLFADVGARDAVADVGAALGSSVSVEVHDPAMAMAEAQEWSVRATVAKRARYRPGHETPTQLWTAWVAAGVRSRAIRALHLTGDAAFDGDRGMFGLSPRPDRAVERSTMAFLSTDDVSALADRVGAHTVSLASPPGNASEVATRVFADALGVTRPGPTLFGSAELDPSGSGLADGHAFLAEPAGTRPIPANRGMFAYLQPEQAVAAVVDEDAEHLIAYETTMGHAPVSRRRPPAYSEEDMPAWMATSQRYIDSEAADLISDQRAAERPSVTKAAYDDGRQQALDDLQDIIERHARPS